MVFILQADHLAIVAYIDTPDSYGVAQS